MHYIFVVVYIFFHLAAPAFFNVDSNDNGIVISAPEELNQDFLLNKEAVENIIAQMDENIFDFAQKQWELFYELRDSLVNIREQSTAANLSKVYATIHETMKKGVVQHPLFLCSECGSHNKSKGPSSTHCPLQRKEDKAECARELFLRNIMKNIHDDHKKGIIFYASGGSLFELQTLTAFIQKGILFEHVFFIDPEYDFTLENIRLFNKIFSSLDFPGEYMNANVLRRIYRTMQIAYFLWSIKPDIKIHFYKKAINYIADVRRNPALQADALIAMDPIDNTYTQATGEFTIAPLMKSELHAIKYTLSEGALFAINYRQSGLDLTTKMEIIEHHPGQCGACNAASARSICSICRAEFYCNRVCQTSHWPIHKHTCSLVKEVRSRP